MAMSAAISAVVTPIQTTTVREDVTPLSAPNEKSGYIRATRKTPAATMVAAWISALTGVGPSMASGSQTCRGTCPDFPIAPQKINRPMIVEAAGPHPPAVRARRLKASFSEQPAHEA